MCGTPHHLECGPGVFPVPCPPTSTTLAAFGDEPVVETCSVSSVRTASSHYCGRDLPVPPAAGKPGSRDSLAGRAPALLRVPTPFVLKYTLRPRPEASGAHEAVQRGPGHARELGDGGLRDAQLEEAPDLVLLAVEP